MACASLPASGSVSAKHIVCSPRTNGVRYVSHRCFGRSISSGVGASGLGGPTAYMASRMPLAAASSTSNVMPSVDSPQPPTSSGRCAA